ncbi:MAG: hypothetical protein IK066_05285, partial [Kiritimatiellae bacterium]|nr:hypothetical protein [Kiritimatiellia bacterium]
LPEVKIRREVRLKRASQPIVHFEIVQISYERPTCDSQITKMSARGRFSVSANAFILHARPPRRKSFFRRIAVAAWLKNRTNVQKIFSASPLLRFLRVENLAAAFAPLR